MTRPSEMSPKREYHRVVIPSGQQDSGEIRLDFGEVISMIVLPSVFTGSSITFRGGINTGDRKVVEKDGTVVQVNVNQDTVSTIDPVEVYHLPPYVVIRSSSTEAADRELHVFTKAI